MNFLDYIESLSADVAKTELKNRFTKNLEFFKKNDAKLCSYLLNKPSVFGLVFDEHGANVLNLSSNTLVYPIGEDGRHTAIAASKEMAKNPLSHTKWRQGFSSNPFYMVSSQLAHTAAVCKEIFGYAHVSGMNPSAPSLDGQYLPSALLYGLGGGFALEAINEECEKIDSLFIYEPFADFFAISAYFVDYPALYVKTKNLFLSIGDVPGTLIVREFFAKSKFSAIYPRPELTMFDAPQINELKNIVEVEAGALLRGMGSYEDEMIGWRNSQKNCSYKNIKHPIFVGNTEKIEAPICVVGNGASLDDSLEFLRQNSEKMVIFAAGTALRTLLKNGIRPDFQIEIERSDYLGDILREAGVSDIDMIAANVVDPDTLASSSGDKMLFFRDSAAVSFLDAPRFVLPFSSPFVGNAAFSLALNISKSVILCGMDAGYKKGRKVHSKDSIYDESDALPEGSVRVKANFEESEIYSNHLYRMSKNMMEYAIYENKSANVTNLSDGAFIAGAKPAKNIELSQIDKKATLFAIKNMFSQDKDVVFAKDGLGEIGDKIASFKSELFAIFGDAAKSKAEFFEIIRKFEAFAASKEQGRDVLFLLFGGSLKHIVFSFCVAVWHTKPQNFEEFYSGLALRVLRGFESMLADFEKEVAKGRAVGLLGGLKLS
ncbi:MAG: 6-hydroxymethylpterin diphosphokinase MptE-like protein [Campylobacterales bacterium]